MLLENSNVLVGVTGGIAAYKAAEFVRLLKKQGANIRVVMTHGATKFVAPLTFKALSGDVVYTDLFNDEIDHGMDHIALARWADRIIIIPASANIIHKLAYGVADDLLSTLCLATTTQLTVVPAMNQQMWMHSATQSNIVLLKKNNCQIIGPTSGDQACGEYGPGRMIEPNQVIEHLINIGEQKLKNKKILITAGPTREYIDPVRYLSNRSSGKMGYALVQSAHDQGADVTLVSGPVDLVTPKAVKFIAVQTADEMYQSVMHEIADVDIFISVAAVADYKASEIEAEKIKKSQQKLALELVSTRDVLTAVAHLPNKPFCVGFAAESQNLEEFAQQKLASKKADMIVANPINLPNQGFEVEYNEAFVVWHDGSCKLPVTTKQILANQLMTVIEQQYSNWIKSDE